MADRVRSCVHCRQVEICSGLLFKRNLSCCSEVNDFISAQWCFEQLSSANKRVELEN
jgi:hypothetical protein